MVPTPSNPPIRPRGARALMLSAFVAAAVSAFPPPAAAGEAVTGRHVRAAILRAVAALKDEQQPAGTWPNYAQEGGVTALVTYALLEAGVAADDADLAKAVEYVRRLGHRSTYVVSLKVLALAAADPKRYRAEIQSAVDWLVEHQSATGAWGYGTPPPAAMAEIRIGGALEQAKDEARLRQQYERPDASNSQFALLALAEADRVGARVPARTWQMADRHFRASQLPGGGWGYVYHDPDPEEAYGSITAAVLAGLYLCHERLASTEPAETTADRLAVIERGIEWITQRFTLKENPNRALAWYYFWLYSLERLGVISGRRTFGDHDWFQEGTDLLVRGQRPDGRWTDRLYYDSLCLLFLVKGYRPLLVQRLMWPGPWRRDPRDLNHLVTYLGERVGGTPVDWRTVDAAAPMSDYLAAPILHMTGRGPIGLPPELADRLAEYVRQGGLLVLDAEGGDTLFRAAARDLVRTLFPDAPLAPLPADHPLARAVHRVDPAALGIQMVQVGCRVGILLAEAGLADAWAKADPSRPDAALRFGENLAVYAVAGDTLPQRLDRVDVFEMPDGAEPADNVCRIGQIQHDGDWDPRPYALPAVLKELADRFGVSVHSRPVPVRLGRTDLSRFPVLVLTGHQRFRLSDAERAALKGYLDRGGFVWAHACCGRAAFDKALRGLVADLFPDSPLTLLPEDHDIYSGKVGPRIETVRYSGAVRAAEPDLDTPVLYGLERGGHLVMVYSPYGLADGLDGLKTYGARSVDRPDARRLVVNILLYALAEP